MGDGSRTNFSAVGGCGALRELVRSGAEAGAYVSAPFLDERQEPNRLPVDRRMVDRQAALIHDFLKVLVAQRPGPLPAGADQDHVDRKAHTVEVDHGDS
jgi:hypothetical protein